jgi:hypothetical protein
VVCMYVCMWYEFREAWEAAVCVYVCMCVCMYVTWMSCGLGGSPEPDVYVCVFKCVSMIV